MAFCFLCKDRAVVVVVGVGAVLVCLQDEDVQVEEDEGQLWLHSASQTPALTISTKYGALIS